MATSLRAALVFFPLILFWQWSEPRGALAAAAVAGVTALLARRRAVDATLSWVLAALMAAAAASVLLAARRPQLQAEVTLLAGVAMVATALLGRPWTAAASAPDWPGMETEPLFLGVNQVLSVLWGLAVAAHAVAVLRQAGPMLAWAPIVIAGVLSLLPGVGVRWLLARRLRLADPSRWRSPLLEPATDAATLDVAVVGAGIGGLTAAALLARAGARVGVYEQHDKPGGFCHSWEAVQGLGDQLLTFRFDAGVHDVSGTGAGGTVRKLLARLGLDGTIEWRRLDHSFVDANGRWDVPRDWHAFTQQLAGRFPGYEAQLGALLADIRQIHEDMYSTAQARGGVPGLPATVPELMAFARGHPMALHWLERPFTELLDHHHIPPEARRLLLSLAGYVTHDERGLRVGDYVPLFGYFLHGGHYPVGGSGVLAQALADSLALDGGEVHLGTPVQRVLVDASGAAAGLRLRDGREVRARTVVVNGDLIAFARALLPDQAWPSGFHDMLEGLQPAGSMFSVHLGIRGDLSDLPPVVHLQEGAQGRIEMVLPGVVDPSAAPAGYQTVELMRLLPPEEAAGWFDHPEQTDPRGQRNSPGYQQRKARMAEGMIAAAGRLIPQLRERIVFQREASPLTFRRYAFSTRGAIYGIQGAFGQVKRRSPVRGLVFAGAMTRGPGVEPAMMSGAEAADALLPGLLAQGRRLPRAELKTRPAELAPEPLATPRPAP